MKGSSQSKPGERDWQPVVAFFVCSLAAVIIQHVTAAHPLGNPGELLDFQVILNTSSVSDFETEPVARRVEAWLANTSGAPVVVDGIALEYLGPLYGQNGDSLDVLLRIRNPVSLGHGVLSPAHAGMLVPIGSILAERGRWEVILKTASGPAGCFLRFSVAGRKGTHGFEWSPPAIFKVTGTAIEQIDFRDWRSLGVDQLEAAAAAMASTGDSRALDVLFDEALGWARPAVQCSAIRSVGNLIAAHVKGEGAFSEQLEQARVRLERVADDGDLASERARHLLRVFAGEEVVFDCSQLSS